MADINPKDKTPGTDRFERSDAPFGQIGIWMIVISILVLITAYAGWEYLKMTNESIARRSPNRSPLVTEGLQQGQVIPRHRLQLDAAAHMRSFAEEQKEYVGGYSWINKETGIVRLPVNQAIDIALENGSLKSRQDAPAKTAIPDDGASLPQDSSSGRTYWNLIR